MSSKIVTSLANVRNYARTTSDKYNWTISDALLKLQEELGELSEGVLVESGALPHKTLSEPLQGEIADVMIAIMDCTRNFDFEIKLDGQVDFKPPVPFEEVKETFVRFTSPLVHRLYLSVSINHQLDQLESLTADLMKRLAVMANYANDFDEDKLAEVIDAKLAKWKRNNND